MKKFLLLSAALLAACGSTDLSNDSQGDSADSLSGMTVKNELTCDMASTTEGVAVICDGDTIGMLSNGKDGAGCSMTPLDSNLGYSVVCGEQSGVILNGKDGANGKDGVDGNDGVNGVDGSDGVNGIDGVNGVDGTSCYATPYESKAGDSTGFSLYCADTLVGIIYNGVTKTDTVVISQRDTVVMKDTVVIIYSNSAEKSSSSSATSSSSVKSSSSSIASSSSVKSSSSSIASSSSVKSSSSSIASSSSEKSSSSSIAISSASFAPFYFESLGSSPEVNSALQQSYWNDLMKYKVFGAHGIVFYGQDIRIPDEVGWFGTADGDFDMSLANTNHVIAGPILIGGDMILGENCDTLTTGPVRVTGNVTMGSPINWHYGSFAGTQCVAGTVADKYAAAVGEDYSVYFGDDYENCPSSVPEINEDLRIPALNFDGVETLSAITANNSTANIDVPSGTGTYDIYIDKITMGNSAELNIRMPSGGRLTRIFVKNGFSFSGHPKIRVEYMSSDAVYDNTSLTWISGTATGVENIDYSGNLLFYTTRDIDFPAITSQDSIQGTFITTGTLLIQQYMTFAGQIIADKVSINAYFGGSGFRYVPFNP